ncbi:hypothetical protein PV403_24400 [Paenibacillus sp. GYB006]|uniref:hypothetical protein n=1 Tax=Paenibacillus sp. GYB006 TaxID=2994394 RepID=UPI002F96398E
MKLKGRKWGISIGAILVIASIGIGVLIMGASSGAEEDNLEMGINVTTLDHFKDKPIMSGNDAFYSQYASKSLLSTLNSTSRETAIESDQIKVNIEMDEDNKEEFNSKLTFIPAEISGMLHLDKDYNFEANGKLDEVIFDGRTVYVGSMFVDIDGGIGEGALSIRYEPENEKIDLSITLGEMDTNSNVLLPYGEAFLTWDELTKIDEIRAGK